MPEKLQISIKDNYLYAEVSGKYNAKNANEFFEEIIKQCYENNIFCILIDARKLEGKLSVIDRYEFGIFMESKRIYKINVALVGTTEYVFPDKFLETVAKNRAVNAKVTTDIKEAELWLKGKMK
jgi:hypothetical protein